MITIQALSHHIRDKVILDDINVHFPAHKLTAIIGPNGAGKSTLLNIMARLIKQQSGTINYADCNLAETRDDELAKVFAILSQQSHISSRVTVAELLMFGRYPHHRGRPTSDDTANVTACLEQFDLTAFADRFIDTLSGGQRQRALIAMVFCQATPYILLDEPLNNLDLYHTHQLMTLIRQATQNTAQNKTQTSAQTIVIVMHDINHAIAFADNIVAMQDGKIAYQGTPEQVVTAKNIKHLYNVDVEIIRHNEKVLMI